MGANLDRLMKSYGVSTPTVSAYSGVAAPAELKAGATAGEQGAYQGALTKYNAQKAAYDQYTGEYRNRINNTDLYSSPYLNILPPNERIKISQFIEPLTTPDYSGIRGSMANLSDTTTVDPTVYTNPDYNSMVNAAYGSLGRTGIGTSASNIDQPGYDYWTGQLRSGAISPNDFTNKFKIGANAYIGQNPDTDYTKYVQGYLGITPAVTTTAADTTTGGTTTVGATTAPDTYSQSYDEDGNERYAHGGPVRHFYGGGSNIIDGGMTDLANKYALNNPADLPVIFAEVPTGTVTDAGSVPVSDARLRSLQGNAVRSGEPPMQRGIVPASAIGPAPDGTPAPVMAPPSADAARDALYDKYFKRGPDSDAVIAARKSVEDNRAALLKSINDQMGKSEENAPSKAEMYFRLAAALAAPTKTGGFMENVGLAAKELGEFQKSTTDAKRAAAAARLQMLLKTNEISLQAAQEGLADLQRREGEDNANRKAFGLKLFDVEQEQNKPLTDAQKRAMSLGFKKGTPEYNAYIAEDDAARKAKEKADLDKPSSELGRKLADLGFTPGTERYKVEYARLFALEEAKAATAAETARTNAEAAKKRLGDLSPKETDLRTETEDLVANLTKSAADLKRAYAINPNTYKGSWGDRAAMFLQENLGTDDPIAINTREQINLLSSQALSALKETFPGAISNDERKALLDLQGIGSKSLKERAIIIMRGYEALQTSLERNKKRIDKINSGYFRKIERPVEGATDGK